MNKPYCDMFKNPREACIFLLQREKSLYTLRPEVRQKIMVDVGCSRPTLQRAIKDLKVKQFMIHTELSLTQKDLKKVFKGRNYILRETIDELRSHLRFMFGIKDNLEDLLLEFVNKVKYNQYETDRLALIRKYAGLDLKEDENK